MIVRHFHGRLGLGYRGHGFFGLLLLAVLVALLVVAVMRLVQMRRQDGRPARPGGGAAEPSADPAIHELRLRYARGELTREEFLERSHHLGSPPGATGAPSA